MKVYEALIAIYETPRAERMNLGICSLVGESLLGKRATMGVWEDVREAAFLDWPEFSGDINYPVKGPLHETHSGPARPLPTWAYSNLPKWNGEYGDSRQNLLEFLIDWFESRDL